MKRRASTAVVLGVVVGALISAASAAEIPAIKVIVHPGIPGKSIPRSLLVEIFLRRSVKWGDGTPIQPVDQLSNAPARVAFNRGVLGFSALDVQQFWVSQISKGKIPPPVKKTEEDVIAFVAANAGAIGYLAESTTVPETVRVLAIE